MITILLSLFILIQGIFAQVQYCPQSTYCISVEIPTDANTNVTFKLEAPSNVGWVGVGIGDSMLNNYLVLAWLRTDGTIAISQRMATSYSVPNPIGQQSDLTLDSTSGINSNDNKLVIIFRRPLTVEGSTINSTTDNFIWALHTSDRPPDDPNTMQITEHSSKGSFLLSTGTKVSSGSRRGVFKTVHGIFMFLAWAVAAPLGIFFARFARNVLPKRWFSLHWGFQALATLPLTVAGLMIIFLANVTFKTSEKHHVIGIVVVICLFTQLSIGVVHHQLYTPQRKYIPWWTRLHWWFGRLLALLALVQISFGLQLYDEKA